MAGIGKKILTAIFGVVATIVIWEVKDFLGFGPKVETASEMPARLWDGGGATITIKTDLSHDGYVHFMFSGPGEDGPSLEGRQSLPAGVREFVMDVPKGAGCSIDLGIENPAIGAKARIEYLLGGRLMMADENTLTEPLREGWAFAVQISAEDLAAGILEDGRPGGEGGETESGEGGEGN